MFAKTILAALLAIVALFGASEAQYVYPAYSAAYAYPSYYGAAAYSPYYAAAAYPAYYGWGSNKGAAGAGKPFAAAGPQKLTNNQKGEFAGNFADAGYDDCILDCLFTEGCDYNGTDETMEMLPKDNVFSVCQEWNNGTRHLRIPGKTDRRLLPTNINNVLYVLFRRNSQCQNFLFESTMQ
ncbi:unnamed protein product [Caenorhabditis bovis]|uniref:Uncharacterized protein n=1 Tax=Caenorhabditis bovis TaxID=2654633 RepID=A0A8S1EZW3_9PELO|nr:unnamed protein product [Caenorhabditis bovis]